MAVKHDNQGFLIGESVDLDKTFTLWNEIKDDLRAIRAALTGSTTGGVKIPKISIEKPEAYSPRMPSTKRQLEAPIASPMVRSSSNPLSNPSSSPSSSPSSNPQVTRQPGRDTPAGNFLQAATPLARKALPGTAKKAPESRPGSASTDFVNRASAKKAATPASRNAATGRFEKKNGGFGNRSGNDNERSSFSNDEGSRAMSDAASKIVGALGDISTGAEETDPTIKAFNEVSQPLSRGLEMLSLGDASGDKLNLRWFRRIFGELRLFRKEETLYSKAANKSLDNIEEFTEASQGGDSGGSSWLMRYVLPLVIAGAGWLMSGWGKKYRDQLSNAHNKAIDKMSQSFDFVTEKLTSFIEGVSGKIESAWSTFTGFIKDKLGIDINKALKPAAYSVKNIYQTAKGHVSSAMSRAYDTVEAGAGSVLKTIMPAGYRTKKTFYGVKGGDDLGRYGSYTEAEAQRVRALKTSSVNTSANVPGGMPLEIQSKIAAQAKKHGLDPVMMQKIAAMESGGNPNAISRTGAIGVFQFTGQTASGVGIKNRFDVDENIDGGMKLTLENMQSLKKSGLPITAENLYMMHQIGPQAAKEVIRGAEKGTSKVDLSRDTQDKMNLNYGKNSGTAAEYINTNKAALDKRYASVVGASMPGPGNTFASPVSFSEAKSVFAPAPGIPSISSAMPSIPDAPPVITPMGSLSGKRDSNNAVMPQEVGQDIKDRRIAHIVTGGYSA